MLDITYTFIVIRDSGQPLNYSNKSCRLTCHTCLKVVTRIDTPESGETPYEVNMM